jgi:hypothetical protein
MSGLPGSGKGNNSGNQQSSSEEQIKKITKNVLVIYFFAQYIFACALMIAVKWPNSNFAGLVNLNGGTMWLLSTFTLLFGFFWVNRINQMKDK